MDLEFAVVTDEPKLAEFIHEEAHSRPGCPDHFCERFLADLGDDGFGSALLAEIRQQHQETRQALLAAIEQMVDQIGFDPGVAADAW